MFVIFIMKWIFAFTVFCSNKISLLAIDKTQIPHVSTPFISLSINRKVSYSTPEECFEISRLLVNVPENIQPWRESFNIR